jgi:hypothetical protein
LGVERQANIHARVREDDRFGAVRQRVRIEDALFGSCSASRKRAES